MIDWCKWIGHKGFKFKYGTEIVQPENPYPWVGENDSLYIIPPIVTKGILRKCERCYKLWWVADFRLTKLDLEVNADGICEALWCEYIFKEENK